MELRISQDLSSTIMSSSVCVCFVCVKIRYLVGV